MTGVIAYPLGERVARFRRNPASGCRRALDTALQQSAGEQTANPRCRTPYDTNRPAMDDRRGDARGVSRAARTHASKAARPRARLLAPRSLALLVAPNP